MSASRVPLRMGMVGGGPLAFIGPVHRMGAELDGEIRLVAGAFASTAERSREAGQRFGIDDSRAYADYATMFREERVRADGIDFVAIVTPTHLHYPIAKAALEAGLHVLCDKPVTATAAQAQELASIVASGRTLFGVSYTYSGYPMLREARARCLDGTLGKIRKVVVEYSQGWLSEAIELKDNKQAAWRTDPNQAGLGGCIGDIGVHAFHIAEFVSGQRIVEICADLSRVVPGRQLDDDCNVLLRFDNGAPGVLLASQIATGDRNGMRVRIWGDRGGLDWSHEEPGLLRYNRADMVTEVVHAGSSVLCQEASAALRLPVGHPEGFIEAFANIYRDFASAIRSGRRIEETSIPGIADGLRGMRFVEEAVRSGRGWRPLNA
jgi:predicted dehydrogenase